jgi:phosphoadenosine phosphosulfate reductase
MASDSRINLDEVNATLEGKSAKQRIEWAIERFTDSVVLLSSMQKTAAVLMHHFHELALPNEILFVDTGYHFFETLRMRDEYMRRFHLNIVTLYPSLTTEEQETKYGKKLFTCTDGQPDCCHMRKEAPLLEHLARKTSPVVVNGLRRGEGGRRAGIRPLGPDRRTDGYQLSPLCDWSEQDIEDYIARHALPVHPLYLQNYLSIGCYPCTTPVRPGEDARAGRWRHLRPAESDEGPKYCNINFSDGGGI